MNLFYIITQPFIFILIQIINTLYPIHCIENKYNKITFNNDLTQIHWNMYMMFLKNSSNLSKSSFDMFDILIQQNIEKINFDITVAITRSVDKSLSFIIFYNKLKKILGDAIDIKYRYTTNICFKSIMNDDGPYRRFYLYDII